MLTNASLSKLSPLAYLAPVTVEYEGEANDDPLAQRQKKRKISGSLEVPVKLKYTITV